LALPLLVWAPPLLAFVFPALRGIAEFVLAYVALAGLLLPFTVPDRGERAGTFLDRIEAYRAAKRTSEPAQA
jgi:hypothetical protein